MTDKYRAHKWSGNGYIQNDDQSAVNKQFVDTCNKCISLKHSIEEVFF